MTDFIKYKCFSYIETINSVLIFFCLVNHIKHLLGKTVILLITITKYSSSSKAPFIVIGMKPRNLNGGFMAKIQELGSVKISSLEVQSWQSGTHH